RDAGSIARRETEDRQASQSRRKKKSTASATASCIMAEYSPSLLPSKDSPRSFRRIVRNPPSDNGKTPHMPWAILSSNICSQSNSTTYPPGKEKSRLVIIPHPCPYFQYFFR